MTDDQQPPSSDENIAKQAVTDYLKERLGSANLAYQGADPADPSYEDLNNAWQDASIDLSRWEIGGWISDVTAVGTAHAVIEQMEDDEKLVPYAEESADVNPYFESRRRAAVTREWLRNQGYDIPDYPNEPGL